MRLILQGMSSALRIVFWLLIVFSPPAKLPSHNDTSWDPFGLVELARDALFNQTFATVDRNINRSPRQRILVSPVHQPSQSANPEGPVIGRAVRNSNFVSSWPCYRVRRNQKSTRRRQNPRRRSSQCCQNLIPVARRMDDRDTLHPRYRFRHCY